jgi:hypothetical protein
MLERRRVILLITSTIAPAAGTTLLKVTDPVSRLAEYCAAFSAYIDLLDRGVVDHIVYADNSGHPLDELKAIARDRGHMDSLEFLSFRAEENPTSGRYYLEMRLIDTVFQISDVLSVDLDQTVWKVTGRYIVGNISQIITSAPPVFDLYVNCRNYPMRFLDFFLVGFRSHTYPRLLGRDIDLYKTSSLSGEIILRNQIDAGAFQGFTIIPRFRKPPKLTAGRRGYDGASYASKKEVAKYAVRRVARVLTPWLWF